MGVGARKSVTRIGAGSSVDGVWRRGRLTEARSASRVELILEPLVAPLQPVPLVLRTRHRVAHGASFQDGWPA